MEWVIFPALFMAWAIGVNDSAKAVGTAVGSGLLGFKKAILIIVIFTTLGVFFGGRGVSATVGELAMELSTNSIGIVLFSAATAVTISSMRGLPISTTQSIIGGLVGAILAFNLRVKWGILLRVVFAWILSPLAAAVVAVVVYEIYTRLFKGIKQIQLIEVMYKWLIFTSAAFSAFNLGANELSNVVGLMGVIGVNGFFKGILSLALAFGALTFSYEVIMSIGKKLTPLDPRLAFSSQFGSAIAVTTANVLGLPVSSGQAVIGGVTGLGHYVGNPINWELVRGIVLSWLFTPVISGSLTFLFLHLLP
ncbi:sodium:phosphate symporter [Thermococcus sp. EP1]|uniref:inorganic phosphate transporter n=1 Tax=Thermococcus sp. EP1 TaxID=1591054 RepID=UPI0006D97B01|nr:inorganic phosphate transporter [Thermococcus sp. EP1]KPU63781.1 sodium:phosphate symporter [Thermococcus sp. EP1]